MKKSIIVIGIILSTILAISLIEAGIVSTTEITGKTQNYNIDQQEQITMRNRTKYWKIHWIRKQSSIITTKNFNKYE